MNSQKLVIYIIFLIVGVNRAHAGNAWDDDARRADAYFYNKDCNAAWLFFERAIANGCNDGQVLFRAATSLMCQQILDDKDFVSDLFATAHYYLTIQDPEDPSIVEAKKHFSSDTIVNKRFLRRVYGRAGGKVPKEPLFSDNSADVFSYVVRIKSYLAKTIDKFLYVYSLVKTEGVHAAVMWISPRLWELLLDWLILCLLPGVILPLVMAVAVSKEGRKSYVTAYALLLFWGLLGLHRFYLKRWKSGLVWLLTGGILGLGLFFDIFLTGAYIRFWNEDNKDKRNNRNTE